MRLIDEIFINITKIIGGLREMRAIRVRPVIRVFNSYPRGSLWKAPNSTYGHNRGLSVPAAFKLDHFQPIKLLLFPNFHIFFTFILGGQFLLP